MLVGRDKELAVVREHVRDGRNLVVFGPAGMGKTTLVTEAIRDQPGAVYCADTSTLKIACESVLAQIGLTVRLTDNVARKRAILRATAGQRRCFVFDHVGRVSPKLASFLETVRETHSMILVTRTVAGPATGWLKMILWDFDQLELAPLSGGAMRELLRAEIGVCESRLERGILRVARGCPGVLMALCRQAHRGRYLSPRLLDLDRRIAELPGSEPFRP